MSLHDVISKIKHRKSLHIDAAEYPENEVIELDENGGVISRDWMSLFKKIFLSLVIILVSSLSFGIGRLSVVGDLPAGKAGREPIKIEYDQELTTENTNQTATVTNATQKKLAPPSASDGGVVASKNGSKYHYPYCPGAKQIKETNKITFDSPSLAEAAGYTLAANCSPR